MSVVTSLTLRAHGEPCTYFSDFFSPARSLSGKAFDMFRLRIGMHECDFYGLTTEDYVAIGEAFREHALEKIKREGIAEHEEEYAKLRARVMPDAPDTVEGFWRAITDAAVRGLLKAHSKGDPEAKAIVADAVELLAQAADEEAEPDVFPEA